MRVALLYENHHPRRAHPPVDEAGPRLARAMVDVIFSYTNRNTDVDERSFVPEVTLFCRKGSLPIYRRMLLLVASFKLPQPLCWVAPSPRVAPVYLLCYKTFCFIGPTGGIVCQNFPGIWNPATGRCE
jgi:hypothetical protein